MTTRDFSTISPSAKSLLMVRAQTSLPFARRAAELLWGAEVVDSAREAASRKTHFELRARSIDEALKHVGATRILELAAGLSFRGLDMAARHADVTYLDTDLPEMAAIKASLVTRLHPGPLAGNLAVQPLDALDARAFRSAVELLGAPGERIAIVEEGLLMYLDDAEKSALGASVREALREHGGVWITADVYVRSNREPERDERTRQFLEQHRVEEKKFADFAAAETFFAAQGFTVLRRLAPPNDPWPVRETWVLTV